jgi:hypothetical protein
MFGALLAGGEGRAQGHGDQGQGFHLLFFIQLVQLSIDDLSLNF